MPLTDAGTKLYSIFQHNKLPKYSSFNFATISTYEMYEINGCGESLRWPRDTLYPLKVDTNFADRRQSLGRYSLLANWSPGIWGKGEVIFDFN
jgi:hypothetical protein